MKTHCVLYYEVLSYQPDNLQYLKDNFKLLVARDPSENTALDLSEVEIVFAPLGYIFDSEAMDKFPNLRIIASNTTGIPHIDVKEASKRDITVCALHLSKAFLDTITSTAEHTIGLMLAASRRLPAAHESARTGSWNRWSWGAPRMMSRLRLGIVGYGRLGRKVGSIADSMGMDVSFYDPYVDGGSQSLRDLASRTDVLTIHAVSNSETAGIVSRDVLELLPVGSIVVNTARGELLDTDALLDLLESDHIWAAALDTIEGEYDPNFENQFFNSRIAKYARDNNNLILTPHIGGSTVDAWYETERHVIEAVYDTIKQG